MVKLLLPRERRQWTGAHTLYWSHQPLVQTTQLLWVHFLQDVKTTTKCCHILQYKNCEINKQVYICVRNTVSLTAGIVQAYMQFFIFKMMLFLLLLVSVPSTCHNIPQTFRNVPNHKILKCETVHIFKSFTQYKHTRIVASCQLICVVTKCVSCNFMYFTSTDVHLLQISYRNDFIINICQILIFYRITGTD